MAFTAKHALSSTTDILTLQLPEKRGFNIDDTKFNGIVLIRYCKENAFLRKAGKYGDALHIKWVVCNAL